MQPAVHPPASSTKTKPGKPGATAPPRSSLPIFLRKKTRQAVSQSVSTLRKSITPGATIVMLGIVGAALLFSLHGRTVHFPPPPPPSAAPAPVPAPAPAPAKPKTPAPKAEKAKRPPPPATPPPPAAVSNPSIVALQQGLKQLGLFDDAPNGTIDKQTNVSLFFLGQITGRTIETEDDGMAAIRAAENRAASMLWVLGKFPFGHSLPGWLLASLTPRDPQTLTNAFNDNAASRTHVFKVDLQANLLTVHGRLIPTAAPHCYDFTALFDRLIKQHHVISRACRNSDGQWTMAAPPRTGPQ